MRADEYRIHDFCPTCGVTLLVKELDTDPERFYINARVLQDVDFSSLKHEECDPLSVLRKKVPSLPIANHHNNLTNAQQDGRQSLARRLEVKGPDHPTERAG